MLTKVPDVGGTVPSIRVMMANPRAAMLCRWVCAHMVPQGVI